MTWIKVIISAIYHIFFGVKQTAFRKVYLFPLPDHNKKHILHIYQIGQDKTLTTEAANLSEYLKYLKINTVKVKGKVCHRTGHEGTEVGVKV